MRLKSIAKKIRLLARKLWEEASFVASTGHIPMASILPHPPIWCMGPYKDVTGAATSGHQVLEVCLY